MQDGNLLAPHPFCTHCGAVRYVGSQRALDLGGLANLIARLELRLKDQGRKITEAQRRLIALRLAELQAHDSYSLSREAQRRLVGEVASKYTGISPDVVASYLCSC